MRTTSEVFVDATPTNPLRPITDADLAAYDVTTRARETSAEPVCAASRGPVGEGSADRTPHTALPQPAPRNQAISAKGAAGEPHTALGARELARRAIEQASGHVDTTENDDREPLSDRVKALLTDRLPEVFTEPGPSVVEQIRYSCQGAWSTSTKGAVRVVHRAYTITVAVPVIVATRLTAWAVERPMRLAFIALLLLIGGSALGAVPIISWFVPNAINIPTWF